MQTSHSGLQVSRTISVGAMMTFFCQKYKAGYHFRGESHDFWEFVLILDGNAGVCAGTEIFHMSRGDCIWHKPNEFHSIWAEGDKPLTLGVFSFIGNVTYPVGGRVFRVGETFCSDLSKLWDEAEKIFIFDIRGTSNTYWFSSIRQGQELNVQRFVSLMEGQLSTTFGREMQNERRLSASAEHYLRIISVISENLDKRLSIPEIADECHMSVTNAKRVFAKYAGCGISVYCQKVKTEKAKRMLENGYTVGEIAEALGFENQNYFSSFFKRITGVAPSYYSAGHKQIPDPDIKVTKE